jgi:hypothetical protein
MRATPNDERTKYDRGPKPLTLTLSQWEREQEKIIGVDVALSPLPEGAATTPYENFCCR